MSHGEGRAARAKLSADVAVIFGSGLAALPTGAGVEAEAGFPELGWPSLGVAGHEPRVVRVKLSLEGPDGRTAALRAALVFGRPHLYEGWSEAELERPVSDLAAAGVRRVLLTNASGSLAPDFALGDVVVATELIDLQSRLGRAAAEPARLPVCDRLAAERVAAALAPRITARPGEYVAVPGPQYETPAEAAWLARYGDVVGMSTAPEVRAGIRLGVELCLLSVVVNRASAVGSHEDVVAAASALRDGLAARLPAALGARWPDLTP